MMAKLMVNPRIRTLALSIAAATLAATVWVAVGPAGADPVAAYDPSKYAESKSLGGSELIGALGGVEVRIEVTDEVSATATGLLVNGEQVAGCPALGAPTYVVVGSGTGTGTWYCVSLADDYQKWDVVNRYKGESQSPEDEAAMTDRLRLGG